MKIDVEGHEVDVLRGAPRVLARRPALLVELVEQNATLVASALTHLGYLVARVGTRGLVAWSGVVPAANAVFVQPWHLSLLSAHNRRALTHAPQDVPDLEFDQLDDLLATEALEPQAA